MRIVYNITIYLYYFVIRASSLFNNKAKQWIDGRKNIFEKLDSTFAEEDEVIWFHCASLGEFEQGRPLIEKHKAKGKKHKVLVTFFSPSGYEVRKNYSGADRVFYLPLDTPYNAKRFVDAVKPKMAFFIKYEFWYNYLHELKSKNIPTYLVSGIFRPDHYFFKGFGSWFKKQLGDFTFFFLQNEDSQRLLTGIGYTNSIVAGDTRFDRVFDIAANASSISIIEKFKAEKKTLVAGSTWVEDEKLLLSFVQKATHKTQGIKLIIVPHEIDEKHILSVLKLFERSKVIRFSEANESSVHSFDILIIDNMGMLSSLYKYADIAYVGGGFGNGIHNILEAAVYGTPVIIGPNYGKFSEAKDLIKLKGVFAVSSLKDLDETVNILLNQKERSAAGTICKNYVAEKKGATEKIMTAIEKRFPN